MAAKRSGHPVDDSWKLELRVYHLYRIYDAEGDLLYVGITSRPVSQRVAEHSADKPWAHLIHLWTDDVMFGGTPVVYAVAEAEEMRVIRQERPKANHDGNSGRGKAFEHALADKRRAGDLVSLLLTLWVIVGLTTWGFLFLLP